MNVDLHSFNFGGEDSDAEGNTCLSWRLDPEKSLSDYKITIITTTPTATLDEQEVVVVDHESEGKGQPSGDNAPLKIQKVYYVHKHVLAVGPRRSQYFARLFRSGIEVAEHTSDTSSIELEPSAAKLFPKMLDFMYSWHNEKFVVTPKDAVVMRYLASYFGVKALYTDVGDFIRQDLTQRPTNAPFYVADAILYQDEKVLEVAKSLCAQEFNKIKPEVMAELPLQFFRDMLSSPNLIREENSDILSRHVAAICRNHAGEIDHSVMIELTDNDIMPTVASDAALYLMQLSNVHSLQMVSGTESSTGPTLHERCVDIVSKKWYDMIYSEIIGGEKVVIGDSDYSNLSSELKVKVLEGVVKSLPLCPKCTVKSFVEIGIVAGNVIILRVKDAMNVFIIPIGVIMPAAVDWNQRSLELFENKKGDVLNAASKQVEVAILKPASALSSLL
eukprot:CAMPEP_0196825408 /NCGR_PEP_ID=MMETSP1362-20130617/93036_1 /TAXON_ID=163516 /ORGANISM="Leptocylindrus danicus, Strain CCMP1856" /LENGTH=444 /DNA_ID=CAMNT_0042205827 /DNA_START=148 /DNA_END=1483 /DNA_ORIENTATION=+